MLPSASMTPRMWSRAGVVDECEAAAVGRGGGLGSVLAQDHGLAAVKIQPHDLDAEKASGFVHLIDLMAEEEAASVTAPAWGPVELALAGVLEEEQVDAGEIVDTDVAADVAHAAGGLVEADVGDPVMLG